MNKTLIALGLALSLGACSQNASDQPENSTADASGTAAPMDATTATTSPSGNDSANAVTNTTGTNPTTDASGMGTTGMDSTTGATDTTGTGAGTAMGGTSTGGNSQYSANLNEELRRCDQLSGAERDTCRSDAQARYDQQGNSTPTTP